MNLFCKPLLGVALLIATAAGCGGGGPQFPTPAPVRTATPASTVTAAPTAPPLPTATPGPTLTPTSAPDSLSGTYVGTFRATYDPRAPLSGTLSGTLRFVVRADGSVVVETPLPDVPGAGGGAGRVVGTRLWATGSSRSFGLRSLSGTLRLASGRASGSGAITVVSQSEIASGTWQAQRQF